MQRWLNESFGIELTQNTPRNKSVRPRSWFRPINWVVMPVYKRLPRTAPDVIRPIAVNSFAFDRVAKRYKNLRLSDNSEDLVQSYYADD